MLKVSCVDSLQLETISSEHFRQRSDVFGKSSEIFGSGRLLRFLKSRSLTDENLTHLTQKKLAGILRSHRGDPV